MIVAMQGKHSAQGKSFNISTTHDLDPLSGGHVK
jgi:hypothetical protein